MLRLFMKQSLWSLAKAFSLFLSLLAVNASPLAADEAENELLQAVLQPIGRLTIANSIVDLGEIAQGSSVDIKFPFVVEGEGPVKILGINEECGCLKTTVRPGQLLSLGTKDFIGMSFDSKSFVGPIDKSILIMTDEPRESRMHHLRIKAKIRQMVTISPPLVRFDWTQGTNLHRAVVMVKRLAQQTLDIEKLDFNRDNLEVDVEPVADSWRIRVRWKGEVPVQPFQEMIRITATAPYGNLQIPVLGHVNIRNLKTATEETQ